MLRVCLHKKRILVQVPEGIKFNAPFLSQYVSVIHCYSKAEEMVTIQAMESRFSKVGFKDIEEGEKGEQYPEVYCSTLKYFVTPLASCFVEMSQLKLSEEAMEKIKKIDFLIKFH